MLTECEATSSALRHRSRRIRAALSLVAIMGFLAGCSDSRPEAAAPSETPEVRTRSFEVSIADRRVALAGDTIRVSQGERVEIRWTTDEAASIHLHGYDIEASLRPDRPFAMVFDADASGRFPITTHGFEGGSGAGPSHEHGEHDHGDQAAEQSEHGEKALLYLEVHPR